MNLDRIAALRRTALFASLEDEALAALAARAVERRLQAGEILIVEGDTVESLCIIVQGALRAFRTGPDGREQTIHVEREGATIAEVPVFDAGPAPSTVAAEEPSVVLSISRGDVRQLCMDFPPIGLAALRVMAARLRQCAALVEALSLHEVGQRLAHFFIQEARSRGEREAGRPAFDLTLSREQIAARIGTVREVVSRAMSRLQQEQLIRVDGRRITILDPERLAEYARAQAPIN